MKPPRTLSDLRRLGHLTAARIGQQRAGASLATAEVLRFDLDHARARDAVHLPFDADGIGAALAARALAHVFVCSAAADRREYLQRPDLGRRLHEHSRRELSGRAASGGVDLALIVADGLSTRAIHENAVAFLDAFLHHVAANGWRLAPIVVATRARVALGDEVGEVLNARLAVMLIGERPGLSAADSLGIYLTYAPRVGRADAERNCISNVRAGGLGHAQAAALSARLAQQALQRRLSGVELKDDPVLAAPDLDGARPT